MYAIYATFNTQGLPTGFYHNGISKTIPNEAVRITDDQWQEFLNNQGTRRWDGEKVVEYIYEPTEEEIALQIRSKRDYLIKETTGLQLKSWQDTGQLAPELDEYIRALRDIPEQSGFPKNVIWPVLPE